jgi:hypothetical protein
MKKKFSITLLVAMFSLFSLFIIGFGGAATVEAAGSCAETLLVNVSASENTAFTNCRALQADAARYSAMAAFYTNETNVQRAFEADAARYTGLAAFYTAATAGNCLGIASTGMTSMELVNCLSDSAYQAANPELMASRRFVGVDGSVASQPVYVDSEVRSNNFLYNNEEIGATHADLAAEPVTIEDLRQRIYSDWVIEAEAVDVSILGQPAQGNVTGQPVYVDIEVVRQRIYSDWVIEAAAVDR